eukprot:2112736-Pleurochrysis_carterae.AAC.2
MALSCVRALRACLGTLVRSCARALRTRRRARARVLAELTSGIALQHLRVAQSVKHAKEILLHVDAQIGALDLKYAGTEMSDVLWVCSGC